MLFGIIRLTHFETTQEKNVKIDNCSNEKEVHAIPVILRALNVGKVVKGLSQKKNSSQRREKITLKRTNKKTKVNYNCNCSSNFVIAFHKVISKISIKHLNIPISNLMNRFFSKKL